MMNQERRDFLCNASYLVAGMLGMTTRVVDARALPRWSMVGFSEPNINAAVKATLGTEIGTPNDAIEIDMPRYIKNTEVVEVTVGSEIPDTNAIAILVRAHSFPLAALYHLPENADPYVTTRVEVFQSTDIIAVVRAGDALSSNFRRVIVTTPPEPVYYDPYDDLVNLVE